MSLRDEYINKIENIPTASFNKEQKEIAKKIIKSIDEKDLGSVYNLITQRVKTGFVFDEAPEINHDAVALVKEDESLGINGGLEKVEHKLIIGENYDALKNLCATYIDKNGKGLIDVIYIDPPYNTEASKADGNDYKEELEASKFIYRDKFTRDGWLNMMNERLKLAKRLLSDSGVIFISIDDKEQAYLKVLCDEIFGENNFEGTIIWQTATDNNATQISVEHEYILCYVKNSKMQPTWEIPTEKGKIIQSKYLELREVYKEDIVSIEKELRKYIKENAKELSGVSHYSYVDKKGVFYPGNSSNTKNGDYKYNIIHPITKKVCAKPAKGYRWPYETFEKAEKNGDVLWGEDENIIPKIKKRLETATEMLKSVYYEDNRASSQILADIFNEKDIFNNPKSIKLLIRLFKFTSQRNSIILDFYAGSGSTGQAVMELNEEDGGARQFILVQTPQKINETENAYKAGYRTIDEITRERIYRIINGKGSDESPIKWKYSEDKPYLSNNSVRVFKIENTELKLNDLEKAEKLKEQAKLEFKKLNPNAEFSNDFDIYNELSALNPIRG